jgi:hypothetical protein
VVSGWLCRACGWSDATEYKVEENCKNTTGIGSLVGDERNDSDGLDGWMLNLHSAIIPTRFPSSLRRSQPNQAKVASSKDLERSEKSIRERSGRKVQYH